MTLTTFSFDLSDPQARAFVRALLDGLDQKPEKKPTGPIYTPVPADTPAPPQIPVTFQELIKPRVVDEDATAKVLAVLRQADGTMRAGAIARAAGIALEKAYSALADSTLFKREGRKRWSALPAFITRLPETPKPEGPKAPEPPKPTAPPEPKRHRSSPEDAAAFRNRMVEALRAHGKPMSPKKLAEAIGADNLKVNTVLNAYAGRLFLKDSKERNSGWLAK